MSAVDNESSLISVLYVDDETDLLMIGKIFLERSGLFKVDIISSAEKALSSSCIQSYDAIVSDYQMPRMDGIEFLKKIREQYGDIPFILFSGRGREEVVIEAINNGADFYIQKGGDPISQFEELSHKIKQAVRRKQAEKRVCESEKRVSDIINFLPDATFAINREGEVIAWNRALEVMTGFSAASILGKKHDEYVAAFYSNDHPLLIDLIDTPDEIIQTYYPSFYRDGSSITAESEIIRTSGKPIFVTIKVSRLFNQEGEITGAIETIRDITYLKNTERELVQSEQRYRSIINDQTDYIARFTHDGTITFANEAYRQNYAPLLNLKEVEGKNICDLIQIKNYQVVDEFLGSLTVDAPVKEIELEIIGTDGEKHWQFWTVRALFDEQDIPVEYQVSGKDITRLKRDEEEITFKNIVLKTQQEVSPDAILIVDSEGSILSYNTNFQKLWTIPEDLLLTGRDEPVLQFVSMQPADQEDFLSRVKYLYEHPNEKSFEEIPLRDGRVIERYSSPMLGPEGKYLGRVWFFRDITERYRANEKIRAAYEEQSASEESLQSSYRELLISKEALQNSEFRLRSLIDNTEEAISMLDEEGRVIEWNQSSERISGISKDDALGMYMWDLIFRMAPPHHQNIEHRDRIEQAIRSSLSTGEPAFSGPRIFTATRPDGAKIITRQRIFPQITNQGYQFGSISHDITEETVAKEALRESEERFREMTERSSDLIVILDTNMIPIYVSPSAEEILGYKPEELIGKLPEFATSTIFCQNGPDLLNTIQMTMNGVKVENKEIQACKKDNTHIFVSFSVVPTVHGGIIDGVQVSMCDITKAKQFETALRESQERYRLLADNVCDIIWTADESMHFTYVSPSVTPFLGITQKEALSEPFDTFVTHESYQELQQYKRQWIESIQKGRQIPQNMEMNLEFRRKDGSTVWTEICMTMLYDTDTKFIGIVGVTRDISKRRQTEEALRIANRQLNLLSGITRHDILNKVSVIRSYLFLTEDLNTEPKISEYLQKIDSGTRKIESLIEFTGCYEDLGSTQPIWQNLDTILDHLHFTKQIIPHITIQDYAVFADPMLEKVFENLLDNSIRHGGAVSTIRVSSCRDGDGLIVVWEDNGDGIAESEKEKIFERGFGKNTGLGMFLVREILSLTSITIAENGRPGEGARFEIRVPRHSYRVNA